MKRCHECLSAVEEADKSCPQCGAAFTRKKQGLGWLLALIILGLGSGSGWFLLQNWPAQAERSANQVESSTTQVPLPLETAKVVVPTEIPSQEDIELHHLQFMQGTARPFAGMLLAGARTLIFIQLDDLPLSGTLQGFPGSVHVAVATYDSQRGFALLATDNELPASVSSLPLGDFTSLKVGSPLQVVTADGKTAAPVTIEARGGDGKLALSAAVEKASALLDPMGAAIAFALGGQDAISLESVIPWIQHRGGRELEDVQTELRSMNPRLILKDQMLVFADTQSDAKSIRDGLAEIRRASALASDGEMVRQFIAAEKFGLQRLVHSLATAEPEAAIVIVREGLTLFPDDPTLLTQAVRLMISQGDPFEAVSTFRQLIQLQPDRAEATADDLAMGLRLMGSQYVEDGRFEGGLQLLATANELFPRRADLRMTYAQALAAAGQAQAALAQAEEAARLDPAYERRLAGYRRNARPRGVRGRGQLTEIPFDPKTNVIRADVRVGGFPLEFVVDTGASITIVPVELAQRLSLIDGNNRGVRVQTASGMAEGLLVELPEIQIGRMRLQGLQAIALDLPNSLKGKGLLGMNALSQMNVEIDSERGRLILGGKR